MSLSKAQAGAELAAIDEVMRRLKQSRLYRAVGQITILWGVLQIVEYAFVAATPQTMRAWSWAIVDGAGVGLTIFLVSRARGRGWPRAGRIFGAYALFFGFGLLWSRGLGHMGGRELAVFWRSLFLFGYCVAGLWFGYGFLALGLGLTGAIFGVYGFAGDWFAPALALVAGLGYVLCGLWMLRA